MRKIDWKRLIASKDCCSLCQFITEVRSLFANMDVVAWMLSYIHRHEPQPRDSANNSRLTLLISLKCQGPRYSRFQ